MDLEKMKAMLDSYKVLLEQEKQAALKQHFIDFMAQLGITEADKLNQLEKSFFEPPLGKQLLVKPTVLVDFIQIAFYVTA